MDFLQCVFFLIATISGCLGELMIFQASQMMRAAFVNTLEATTLIWMILFDIWFFDESYNAIAYIGAVGLIVGLLILTFDKEKVEVQVEENKKYLLLNYENNHDI